MPELLRAFRFEVELFSSQQAAIGAVGAASGAPAGRKIGDGGFQECSGLELEAEVQEFLEGGRNDEVIRRPGRVKLQPLVLKRGMFSTTDGGTGDGELWHWFQAVVAGERPIERLDGLVSIIHPSGTPVSASWGFWRGLPLRIKGPTLNAESGDIAVEELHIAPEGLRLLSGT